MFRVSTGEDISDEEFNAIVEPFEDKCNEYLEGLMVSYVGKYIAMGYELSAIWENSYDTHINSALDSFSNDPRDYSEFKKRVTMELRDNYGLIVNTEDPLSFK